MGARLAGGRFPGRTATRHLKRPLVFTYAARVSALARPRHERRLSRVFVVAAPALLVAGLLLTPACAGHGSFIWFSQVPRSDWASASNEYTLATGDTINVRVFEQPDFSGPCRIRPDGRISLPIAGEILAAGRHPAQLRDEIEARLKAVIVNPRVSVSIEQPAPITVSMLGEVGTKGNLSFEPPVTMLQALAQAGGLTDFADKSAIFVIRSTPTFQRIRFTYEGLERNEDGAAAFQLRKGDVIVVE